MLFVPLHWYLCGARQDISLKVSGGGWGRLLPTQTLCSAGVWYPKSMEITRDQNYPPLISPSSQHPVCISSPETFLLSADIQIFLA